MLVYFHCYIKLLSSIFNLIFIVLIIFRDGICNLFLDFINFIQTSSIFNKHTYLRNFLGGKLKLIEHLMLRKLLWVQLFTYLIFAYSQYHFYCVHFLHWRYLNLLDKLIKFIVYNQRNLLVWNYDYFQIFSVFYEIRQDFVQIWAIILNYILTFINQNKNL